jgi:plastocyanin
MSRRFLSVLAITATLTLTACSGGAATGAPTEAPAASVDGGAGAGAGACAPSTDAGTVAATMSGVAFVPATVNASVGDVIVWTNEDSVPHTATLTDDSECTTPNLGSGETGGLTFSAAGTYAFFCKVHPDMRGTIEVTS